MIKVDLNCDMGESYGRYNLGLDSEVAKYISSANIACGYHAGDPVTMEKTVKIMKENGVALELNTSGIRKGYVTSPDTDLLMLYRDCGGERVTCGSDTHRIQDCGADVPECLELLRSCGFTSLVIPTHNKTELIRL